MIKLFVLPYEHASETVRFKGAPEIKEEIDAVRKHLLSKVKKHGLNSNQAKIKRKENSR